METAEPRITTRGKLHSRLARLVVQQGPLAPQSRGHIRIDAAGRVQVYVWTREVTPQLLDDLAALGGEIEHTAIDVVQAWVPVGALTRLAEHSSVRSVEPPAYARASTGSQNTQGDTLLGAKAVRDQLAVTGQGIRVGVLSMGLGGLEESIDAGDLPATTFHCKTPPSSIPPLTIVQRPTRCFTGERLVRTSGGITAYPFPAGQDLAADAGGTPHGEGTAMLEIVHDLAPGAELWFATGRTSLDILAALDFLAANVDVIVSDLGFPGFFPDGQNSMSQAVSAIMSDPSRRARAYIQAAGNLADKHYAGTYTDSGTGDANGHLHRFEAIDGTQGPATGATANLVRVAPFASLSIWLSWDDLPGAATSDYDLLLYACPNGVPGALLAAGDETQDGFGEPQEALDYFNQSAAPVDVCYAIQNVRNAAPVRRLNVIFDDVTAPLLHQYSTPGRSLLPPADAEGGLIAVGAVSRLTPTTIEPFSSQGPTFDGRSKPDLVATDAVWITGAGGFGRACGQRICFDGTSAAAPHVAAIAALVLDLNPALTRTQLKNALMQTAVALGDPNVFGAGRVDAQAAATRAQALITTSPTPTIGALEPDTSLAGDPELILTVTGTGFVPSSVVRWNGADRSTAFVSSTELRAVIPASDLTSEGSADVRVFTPTPGGGLTGARAFTIVAIATPVPTLSSVAPTSIVVGSPTFTLSASGRNFTGSSVVRWNGVSRPTTFVSPFRLEATIPASDATSPGTVQVTVFNPAPGGGTSAARTVTIKSPSPVPILTGLSRNTAGVGEPGFTLTVTGTNFVNDSKVVWDGINHLTTFVSSTELRATIPATDLLFPDFLNITVYNPPPGGGTSGPLPFTIVVPNPVPSLSALSSTSAAAGAPPFTLTVTGSNFVAGSVVRWNGTDLATTFVSGGQLTATVPASDLAAPGIAQVTVFTPAPGGGLSGPLPFTINAPVPVLGGLGPSGATSGGAAFALTVTGSNFVAGSVVRWNGADRATTFVSNGQLEAAVQASDIVSPGTADVRVFTPAPGGGQSSALPFTINAPVPVLGGLGPSSATSGGAAFALTVTGSNFVAGSVVRWNGTDRATTFVSGGQLEAAIPAGDIATPGTAQVAVFTPAPGGGLAGPLPFTINAPVPVLGGLGPSSATSGGAAFALTVTGSNFVAGSVVRWNGTDRATTFVSGGQLEAAIPAGDIATPGTAQVAVFTPAPGGGQSGALPFTINAPVPVLGGLGPSSATSGGAALALTVTGGNFVPGSVVRWNGADRATTFVSASQLEAAIPAGDIATPGTAQVAVFTPAPGGGLAGPLPFTINAPVPVLGGLGPSSATSGGAALALTVTGGNFVPGSVVRWNGADRATTFVSGGQLEAAVLASDIATAGTAQVTVFTPAPGGGQSTPLVFPINPAASAATIVATAVSDPPAAAEIGSSFLVTDSVLNQSLGTADSSTTRYYLSLDAQRGPGDRRLVGSRAVPRLRVGETSSGMEVVTIPSATAPGSYFLLACADDPRRLAPGSEGCHASSTTVQVIAPDLVVTRVTSPAASVVAGGTLQVTDRVKNRGTAAAGTSTTRYYLSTDPQQGSDIPLDGTRVVPALPPGGQSTGVALVVVPSTSAAGAYFLVACADEEQVVLERRERNNCRVAQTPVQVTPAP
jgi:hypothetical protein